MIKYIAYFTLLFGVLGILLSCAPSGKDTSELWAKSQSRGDIVARSGTTFGDGGSDPEKKKLQMEDARVRLQSGGGLLGNKPTNLIELGSNNDSQQSFSSIGLPINPYLWRGSLETVSFMPLASADPFAGVIITDWYTDQKDSTQRCKINIFIKGAELKTDNLKVNSFCQKLSENGNWVDQKIDNKNNVKLENAILNKAKKIKLAQG